MIQPTASKNDGQSQIQVAIGMILEVLADKNSLVAETAATSLKKLAENHPNHVLNCSKNFCKRSSTMSDQIAHVLNIMQSICTEHIIAIDGDTILSLTDFCLEVLTRNIAVDVVQDPACNVLVAIGRKHHIQVLDKLMVRLETGSMPHYMIPYTLGSLASVNATGVVPYLKDIFTIMIPLLNSIKNEVQRQAFAFAFGSFSDALVEYVANINQVPDNSITWENFQSELATIYEVLTNTWLQSRDNKTVQNILTAVTAIFPLLDVDKVSEHTVKQLQTLLVLYKKQVDAYYVTKCLESVIKKATTVDGTLVEPLLGNIMQNMSDLLCTSPDYAKPDSLKTHSEVLRCYECLALYFTDNVIDQLVGQLKNNNDREKVKGLLIITHLTSYSNNQLVERRLKDIMKHFNDVLYESNIKVKKALLKIIVAFASKGILLNKDMNPDGAEKYMEFILKLCCSHNVQKNNDIDLQELDDLQRSADNTLCMLSTSVVELEETLWNLLMKSFLSPNYDNAIVVILRCLTHLAARKESPPICEGAFVRCMVLLAIPLPGFRGTFILNFFKQMSPCKLKNHEAVWDSKIPQLMKYLEQNYDNFNDNEWQDLVFDFFNLLLDAISDEKCFQSLLNTARDQLLLYNLGLMGGDQPVKITEKHFLLKCIALLLCHIKDKDIVIQSLDKILANVKLTDYSELHACAEAIGIISKNHLQLVLDKISIIRKDLANKKMKLFQIPFMKDKNQDLGRERLRYTIICSYAEVCNEAPSEKLLKIIESEILDFVVTELANCKDFYIRKACIKTIGSVADAMHPNRNTLHIHLKCRQAILKVVSSEIHLHNGSDYIELFPIILPVITSLVQLPPTLESDERIRLLKLCFDSVYNASAIYCRINEEEPDQYYGTSKLVPFITPSFTKLNQLVQELLMLNLSPETLDEIVTLLEHWLSKKKAEQRLPACETLRIALQTYLDNMKFAYDCPNNFTQTGLLLSRIVPRCTDSVTNIRKVAVENLCLILCIASRYEGHMRDHDKILSNSMQYIQQQIDQRDPKLLYSLTTDLSNILCTNIPSFQLIHFVEGLIDALIDCESSSSNGSGIILNLTLKSKGMELQNHITTIVQKILGQIRNIKCVATRTSALRAVQSAASHHSKIVSAILLQQPLPFEQSICDCWSMISTDNTLTQNLLDQFKKIMKNTPLFDEHGKSDMKIASLAPLQVVCALHEIFKNAQLKEICIQQFPDLFSILLITLASYIGTAAPAMKEVTDKKDKYFVINREAYKMSPAKIALETFRLFLLCCDYKQMANNLLSFSQAETSEKFPWFLDIISMLVENICQDNPQYITWLVASLGPYIRADLEPQRVAVVAFFTYLFRQKVNDQAMLAENLLEMIMDVQMDQSCLVKQIGLQGLGYAIEFLKPELISRHCKPILSVLMSSLDYNHVGSEGALILEGLHSFSKLLTTLEGHKFSSCQVTAAVRIKPLLGQEEVQLRRASFRLLGDLTGSINTDSNIEAFREQIHGNLITLLLHLCDPDQYVVKACKYTLRQISSYLEGPKTNTMIQEHLIDDANLNYYNFMRDLVKVMSDELQEYFPLLVMTSLSYFKSPWVEIRGNAALVAGLLYSTLNDENKSKVSIDTVSFRLMNLMSDENEQVRIKAVQAIVYLFSN
ncbi:maestro heat-like repeat-containing protein family member 1 [Harmonia axyridis]|uniref:maestro heat-like repeat-containing protein family member 1 n=1 Tax=Harmonia axyridis TaxID=115357 RepID=UPI001E279459|nr:maestro heat-like repeat-containing protein family member 1 [Harmonia axyridis]